nr:hypothetical protein [Rhizobium tubonense]
MEISVPDFSTLSRRSKGLALPSAKSRTKTSGRPIWWSIAQA